MNIRLFNHLQSYFNRSTNNLGRNETQIISDKSNCVNDVKKNVLYLLISRTYTIIPYLYRCFTQF